MIITPSMMLITSKWQDQPTFKMIPITAECPFIEGIFDPSTKVLAVVGRYSMQRYTMTYKLDDNGDPVMTKKPRPNGKTYKEERRLLDGYQEYYIEDPKEIMLFVHRFAVNFHISGIDEEIEIKPWSDVIKKFLEAEVPVVPPGEVTIASVPTTPTMEAVKEE